jgi:hypothetical protein
VPERLKGAAVAREMAGFLWDTGRTVAPDGPQRHRREDLTSLAVALGAIKSAVLLAAGGDELPSAMALTHHP